MTSNLGSDLLLEKLEKKSFKQDKDQILKILQPVIREHFRPEFINRLDEILPFLPLQEKDMEKIVKIQLDGIKKRTQEKNISVTFSDDVIELLAHEGYDPHFGARPLKRLIQSRIVNLLSKALLSLDIRSGDSIEIILSKNHQLEIKKAL